MTQIITFSCDPGRQRKGSQVKNPICWTNSEIWGLKQIIVQLWTLQNFTRSFWGSGNQWTNTGKKTHRGLIKYNEFNQVSNSRSKAPTNVWLFHCAVAEPSRSRNAKNEMVLGACVFTTKILISVHVRNSQPWPRWSISWKVFLGIVPHSRRLGSRP